MPVEEVYLSTEYSEEYLTPLHFKVVRLCKNVLGIRITFTLEKITLEKLKSECYFEGDVLRAIISIDDREIAKLMLYGDTISEFKHSHVFTKIENNHLYIVLVREGVFAYVGEM